MRRRKEQDLHHKIGQCNKGWAVVNDDRNKMIIDKTRHRGLNALFQCLQSPHEQLGYLKQMYDSVLSDTAKQLLEELLELKEWEFYAEGLVKKGALKSKYKDGEN